jgi:hypothetical protein
MTIPRLPQCTLAVAGALIMLGAAAGTVALPDTPTTTQEQK